MEPKQGDLSLLKEPMAQELLNAPIPAHLAYVWSDGTPRVIPIWFHWTGEKIVVCSPPSAPKMKVIADETPVAVAIDYEQWPARSLEIRGTATSEVVDGEIPEYAEITRKYLGEEGSREWRAQYAAMFPRPVRVSVRPEWVALIDVTAGRFPSAIDKAIAAVAPAS